MKELRKGRRKVLGNESIKATISPTHSQITQRPLPKSHIIDFSCLLDIPMYSTGANAFKEKTTPTTKVVVTVGSVSQASRRGKRRQHQPKISICPALLSFQPYV